MCQSKSEGANDIYIYVRQQRIGGVGQHGSETCTPAAAGGGGWETYMPCFCLEGSRYAQGCHAVFVGDHVSPRRGAILLEVS